MRKVLNRVTVFDSEDVATAKACIFVGYPLQTAEGRRGTVRADTSQAGVNSHSIIERTLLSAALRRMTPIASCAARLRSTVNGI